MARARLERYLLRSVLGPFLLGVAGFTFVLLINQVFLLARQTIEKRVPLAVVAGFVVAELPRIVSMTVPMGALLAVLVGYGRLASQHEIVAMRATGVSINRLFAPAALFATLLTGLALVSTHVLEPIGYAHRRTLGLEVMRNRDLSREITPGVFYDELPGAVFYAADAAESPGQGRVFRNVLLFQEAPDGSWAALIVARRGRGVFDTETGRISLLLDDGQRHLWSPGREEQYHLLEFRQHTLTFPPDLLFRALARGVPVPHRTAVAGELPRYIETLRDGARATTSEGERVAFGARLRKAQLEWHRRWGVPLAIPMLILVAFPVAARTTRGGRFAGLTQALLIILAFWLLLSIGTGFSERGTWPVAVGPWLPHVVLLFWALLLWRRLVRGRDAGPGPIAALIDRLKLARESRSASDRRSRGASPAASRPLFLGHLDAYLSRGLIRMTLAALFVLAVLVTAVDLKEAVEEVPSGVAVPWGDVFAYIGASFPGRLRFLLPIGVLIGAMVSLAGLARGNELVAMRASGFGPLRIAAPLIGVTLLLALFYGAVQETVVPATEEKAREARDRLGGRPASADVDSGRRWLFGESDHLWSYLDYDNRRRRVQSPWVVVVDLPGARIVEKIAAREAVREPGGWRFVDGARHAFSGSSSSFERFDEYRSDFRDDDTPFREERTRLLFGGSLADQMSFRELREHARRASRGGYADPAPLLVGLHEKIAQPLLPLLLVAFGIPLMVSGSARKGSLYGFGLALLITFGFWGAWAATTSFGREGVLSPAIAVWLPPALLAAGAVYLLIRAR